MIKPQTFQDVEHCIAPRGVHSAATSLGKIWLGRLWKSAKESCIPMAGALWRKLSTEVRRIRLASQGGFEESPWKVLEIQRAFLDFCGQVRGQQVLVAGDNASLLIHMLLDAGAAVSVVVSNVQAMNRLQQRFPQVPSALRTHAGNLWGKRYAMSVMWDGMGHYPQSVAHRLLQVSPVVWMATSDARWVPYKIRPVPWDTLPDSFSISSVASAKEFKVSHDPLLVHVHVPKNAGTSVNQLMFESFGQFFQPAYIEDPQISHTTQSMDQTVMKNPCTLAISSHSFRVFPERVAGRRALYFTFLRKPVSRHLSYYRYARKHYDNLTTAHRATLPLNFMNMTLTNYLSFESRLYKMGYRFGQIGHFSQANLLDDAKNTLSRFLMVGVVEQMDRGIELLRRKLDPLGIELADLPLLYSNTTVDLYNEAPGVRDTATLYRYTGHLADDMCLYEWAKQRFEEEAAVYGV